MILLIKRKIIPPDPLVMTFNIASNGETLSLPLTTGNGEIYNFDIDWGDGNQETITTASANHIYATSGVKTVTITGTMEGWSFQTGVVINARLKILTISGGTGHEFKRIAGMFNGCDNLTTVDGDNWNVSGVTDMSFLCYSCNNLSTFNVSNWDVSNVIDMNSMFNACDNLTTVDVSNWDVSNVIDMNSMFRNCSSLETIDVTNWVTTAVTNMNTMFRDCPQLTSTMPANVFWENLGVGSTSVVNHILTFYLSTSIQNYNSIPSTWGGGA